ncbi:MAG: alpha amylase C-terminal domain-containing protein [Deltaproteobacteria bacterium]|nr:alpha amylase C-terminal domain-containing protein [Deltaproteobacteria bacterium]
MTEKKRVRIVECGLRNDPYLRPYEKMILARMQRVETMKARLTHDGRTSLGDFASGHEFFGLHFRENQWVFREWAPNARAIFLVGDMTDWREAGVFELERIDEEGVWEIRLSPQTLTHGMVYRLRMHWEGGEGDRIPAYARRVVQDPDTLIFNAQVWFPPDPYLWTCPDFVPAPGAVFVYEAHVGMAQEEAKIGSYREFTEHILPRIVDAGYGVLQLMGIQEHPYYASFGYHVSSFFAASSRFGSPEDLKALIDRAHGLGLSVIMDLVHSHAVANEVEGLGRFDGTVYQYFHEGPRGIHEAWGSRCFDYGKPQVLHFLLSNCRFWLDEYHFDGFRFDGITSMLYRHHGLGKAFTSYEDYFDDHVDEDALTYLTLANELIHDVRPAAVTIAEDISGMPGLAAPGEAGGVGFDYRLAMGVPDFWIKILKEKRDEDWPLGEMWHELTNRRVDERSIGYAESHDQALVGDKTLALRLMGPDLYHHMHVKQENLAVDRGMALHKLVRFITLATAGNGYLNFMGNEFGHPDWIDFPREGNGWSYEYARRQWRLMDSPDLKYAYLARFDRQMIKLAGTYRFLDVSDLRLITEHFEHKILAFERGGLIFVFNFHPTHSHNDYSIEAAPGEYQMIMDSDALEYGGHDRLRQGQRHFAAPALSLPALSLYLPTRTALVLAPVITT